MTAIRASGRRGRHTKWHGSQDLCVKDALSFQDRKKQLKMVEQIEDISKIYSSYWIAWWSSFDHDEKESLNSRKRNETASVLCGALHRLLFIPSPSSSCLDGTARLNFFLKERTVPHWFANELLAFFLAPERGFKVLSFEGKCYLLFRVIKLLKIRVQAAIALKHFCILCIVHEKLCHLV